MTAVPNTQPETEPAVRRRGSATRRMPALVTYVFRACLPRARLAILALPCLTILACGLITSSVHDQSRLHAFATVAGVGIFGLAMPLGALVVGDAVLGAEVRSGTLAFTWLTPARFSEIAVARWFGGWVICLLTLVPSAALAAVLAGVSDQAGTMALATAAGSAAHIAMFVLIGCITRRAAVWSLAVVFLVERLLGAVLSGVAQLSPTWQGRAVFVGLADITDQHRSGIPEGGGAIVRLTILTIVFLVVAAAGLRRLQLTGSRD